MAYETNSANQNGGGRRRKPRLNRDLVARVMTLRQLPGVAEQLSERGVSANNNFSLHGRENIVPEVAGGVFDLVGKDIDVPSSTVGNKGTDELISGAMAVAELMNDDDHTIESTSTAPQSEDTLPLMVNSKTYGTESRKSGRKSGTTAKSKRRRRKSNRCLSWFYKLGKGLINLLFASTLTYIAFPCLLFAAILFYLLDNPIPSFFSGETTASWWLIFIARQSVTYELAKLIQWFIVNELALRNKAAVKIFGPLLTLSLIQNQGWSLTFIFWSLADLCLLHGDGYFQQHWLYAYDIDMFSNKNQGGSFLEQEFYFSILISMFLVGLTHSIKNTMLAINFGKNTVRTYKKRQDKLLSDFVILTEVSTLADNLKGQQFRSSSTRTRIQLRNSWDKFLEVEHKPSQPRTPPRHHRRISSESPMFEARDLSILQEESYDEKEEDDIDDTDDLDYDDDSDDEENDEEDDDENKDDLSAKEDFTNFTNVGSSGSTMAFLKQNLDQFVEPKNMVDQIAMNDVSVADILKFHKAEALMRDDNNPLCRALENVSGRTVIMKRSQAIYRRLVKVTKSDPLHYDIIQCLAINRDNTIDEGKEAAMRSLFRPDFNDQLTLLQFVQAFDNVYKASRVYDAAVSNSSVMNEVLASVVDRIVWFFLILVILLILQYNPYPLLMSMSSLLVSFAFAMGPSASKFIEGILLIAIRRPYDIGDRIILSAPTASTSVNIGEAWIVEDINLWTTKLRHTATNKVATLQNGYIAALRITNCNQSPNALVNLELKVDVKTTDTNKLKIFRERIEDYIQKRPRSYVSLVYFRCDDMDTEQGWALFSIRVRHRLSWQSGGIVLKSKSELLWRCKEICKETGMTYLSNVNEILILDKDDGLETLAEATGIKSSGDKSI
mmetsp:Transcript_30750/g.46623  ORF Transcript_30750/g.46623 Transcript_30750/m.46623 type:complete len:893 (-) Transcript_30750:42-2720(-)